MAGTNGSQKKPGAPDFYFLDFGDFYGCGTITPNWVCNVLQPIVPVALIDVPTFCSQPPPITDTIEADDLFNPSQALGKAVDIMKANAWPQLCEWLPPPPGEPGQPGGPPFSGGQCNIYYRINIRTTHVYLGQPQDGNIVQTEGWGPIGGTRTVYPPGGGHSRQVSTGTGQNDITQRWREYEAGSLGEEYQWKGEIVSVVPYFANQPDDCGNPPVPPNPIPPNDPPPLNHRCRPISTVTTNTR